MNAPPAQPLPIRIIRIVRGNFIVTVVTRRHRPETVVSLVFTGVTLIVTLPAKIVTLIVAATLIATVCTLEIALW